MKTQTRLTIFSIWLMLNYTLGVVTLNVLLISCISNCTLAVTVVCGAIMSICEIEIMNKFILKDLNITTNIKENDNNDEEN